MVRDLRAALASGPLPASQLCSELEALGYASGTVRTTVSRHVAAKRLFRYKLKLGHGNSIVSLRKPHPDPLLFKSLYANNFCGRPALLNFVQCLRSSHPSVTRAEVAALACMEIGDAGAMPEWATVETLLEAFEELGIVQPDNPDGSEPTWLFNKSLFMNSGIGVGVINLSPAHLSLRRRVKEMATFRSQLSDGFCLPESSWPRAASIAHRR